MITEKMANLARDKHSDYLADLGAHAISVDEIEEQGKKSFAVTAFVEKKTDKMPADLEIKNGKKTVKIPLIVRVEQKFKLE